MPTNNEGYSDIVTHKTNTRNKVYTTPKGFFLIAKIINEGAFVAILLMFLPNNLGKVLTIKTENK
jgi:hypothetical protein